jgi:hypothetical protein
LGVEANHVGDSRYFNKSAAQAAITATLQACGINSIDQGIAGCPSLGGPLNMTDFANNGLTSPALDFGGACPFDYGCAFPGINPAAGSILLLYPIGRSVYNGLDAKLNQDWKSPMRGLHRVNFQVAYSLSRFVNNGGADPGVSTGNSDQDLVIAAIDNRNPLGFSGPSLLDRTHQLSFGGVLDLAGGFRASIVSHFYSGLPMSLQVPDTGLGAGEIFRTDFTGDGTVQDLLPGTHVGSFNRDFGVNGLTQVIDNHNSNIAGKPTPAGQVLVNAGLFTAAELRNGARIISHWKGRSCNSTLGGLCVA